MSISGLEHEAAEHPADAGLAVGAAAVVAAAWLAAGSGGFLAEPLREIATWIALGVFFVVNMPRGENAAWRCVPVAAVLVFLLAVKAAFGSPGVTNVFGVALFAAATAMGNAGVRRKAIGAMAAAVAVFGVYRFAVVTIPSVWHMASAIGQASGNLAGRLSGERLHVGATFGGVDFLVLMGALVVAWTALAPPPRRSRAAWAVVAIMLAQTVYLIVLSFAPALLEALPPPPEIAPQPQYTPPEWFWADSVRECLPWSLPLLGLALQSLVAGGIFAAYRPGDEEAETDAVPADAVERPRGKVDPACLVLALMLPMITILSFGATDLKGKTVVAAADSMLDWRTPRHGEYGMRSAGDLGMLQTCVELLGGTFRKCDAVTDAALEGADVLLVACPVADWTEEEKECVRQYVRQGGSLLTVSTPSMPMADRRSDFYEILEETGLRPRMDVVVPPAQQWEYAIAETTHPTAIGVKDEGRHGPLGFAASSSVDTPWPAVPIVVGRYGWSDPGSEAYWKDVYRFERGERLGDMVLAAEARMGKGCVIVLGDARGFVNQGISGAYPFTGRLLAYLADGAGGPGAWLRQLLGLLGAGTLVVLLFRHPRPESIGAASAVFLLSYLVCSGYVHTRGRVLPEETGAGPKRLAYIDASHGEPYSDIPWMNEGIDGLKLALMRDGYLPLMLRDFTEERLTKAGLLILIGPHRPFTQAERHALKKFLEGGGTAVCTVGSEDIHGIAETLRKDYSIRIAPTPVGPESAQGEPDPSGSSFTPYLDLGERRYAQMLLHAGWPIERLHKEVFNVAGGRNGEPVAVARSVGAGYLVVIGDTRFAFNQNLERPGGEPIFGDHANAHFWRWLFGRFADRPGWTPPETRIEQASEEEGDMPGEAALEAVPGDQAGPEEETRP